MNESPTLLEEESVAPQEDQSNPEDVVEATEKTPDESEAYSKPDEPVNYEEKYKESSREAIRLYKETEKLKRKEEFLEKLAQVAKDKDAIHEIAETDKSLANKISLELYGNNYSNSYDSVSEEDSTDVKETVRQVMVEESQKLERSKIRELETNFLVDNNILPGSETFKRITQTYNKYNPKTSKDAKELLEMAYLKHTGSTGNFRNTTQDAASSFGASSKKSGGFTKDDDATIIEMAKYGISLTKDTLLKAKQAGYV